MRLLFQRLFAVKTVIPKPAVEKIHTARVECVEHKTETDETDIIDVPEYGECSHNGSLDTVPPEHSTAPLALATREISVPLLDEQPDTAGFSTNTLLSLLSATEEGKEIIEKAKIGELSGANQLQLATTIAKFHLQKKTRLRTEDLEIYATAITTLFTSEKKVGFNNFTKVIHIC